MLFKKIKKTTLLAAALLTLAALSGCGDKKGGPGAQAPGGRAPQVSVIEVKPGSVPVVSSLQGRTTPFLVSDVRPQVTGILQKRLFTEGSTVKEGEPLYQIDPSLYAAQLESAKAELQRAKAALTSAELTFKRYGELVKSQAVSRQDHDNARAAYLQAQAAVAAAEAAVKNAQINFDYTTVRAPISGKIGRTLVTPGALLTAHQAQNMAVVQTLDPIYVDVTQSSKDLLNFKKQIAEGRLKADTGTVPVTLILEDGTVYAHKGALKLSEVSVDPQTGSVTLRAEFPNPEELLLPGMFVRTQITEGVREHALTVPQRAVMRQPDGQPFVYVVEDGKIAARTLKATRTVGSDWLVEEGLKGGEKVVIEGLQRIRPGVPVQIVPTIAEQAAAAQKKQTPAAE